MIGADDGAFVAPPLEQAGAAVHARIGEGAEVSFAVAHHDDGLAGDGHGQVIAGIGQFVAAPGENPGFHENVLHLGVVKRLRGEAPRGQGLAFLEGQRDLAVMLGIEDVRNVGHAIGLLGELPPHAGPVPLTPPGSTNRGAVKRHFDWIVTRILSSPFGKSRWRRTPKTHMPSPSPTPLPPRPHRPRFCPTPTDLSFCPTPTPGPGTTLERKK